LVVLIAILVAGVALALACGGQLDQLKQFRLRGETVLVLVLIPQLLLPAAQLQGPVALVAYWVWLATFPLLIGICLLNSARKPLVLVATGLALNGLVVALNGGMPVSPQAVAAASAGATMMIRAGDFAHVAMTAATRLPLLGDVLPLQGPGLLRMVASPGDLLLACGVSSMLAAATVGSRPHRFAESAS
jgi:hypothetical protein